MVSLIAAHPDDVLLGAYSLLESSLDVYVLSTAQRKGSVALAKRFGYDLIMFDWERTPQGWMDLARFIKKIEGYVWFPSPLDINEEHRLVSSLAWVRSEIPSFYTVMPIGYSLPVVVTLTPGRFSEKKLLFATCFPEESRKYMHVLKENGPIESFSSGLPLTWKQMLDPLPMFERSEE